MQLIVIDIEPVQGNLLKFAQYKSKLSMKNPCASNISSWHKNILAKSVVEYVEIARE